MAHALDALQIGAAEIGVGQLRAGKVGALQVGLGKDGAAKIAIGEKLAPFNCALAKLVFASLALRNRPRKMLDGQE